MPKTKWFMKQYWRVNTIRTLASLVLGMLVLGRYYYQFVPVVRHMGILGAVALGLLLIALFIGIGWAYDVRLKQWNEAAQVSTERYPYQYVPDPRARMMDYPALYAVLSTFSELAPRFELSSDSIRDLVEYLDGYFARSPESRKDIRTAMPSSEAFMQRRPFVEQEPKKSKRLGRRWSVAKGFQREVLRIGWIQSLTGLVQDVLIFAVFYAVIIFPSFGDGGTMPLHYLLLAILIISFPIFSVLMMLGWYYDRKLRVWAADVAVNTERNPYSYVPAPTVNIMHMPMYYTLLFFFWNNAELLGLDRTAIENTLSYLEKYRILSPSRDEDIKEWSVIAAKREWFLGLGSEQWRQE